MFLSVLIISPLIIYLSITYADVVNSPVEKGPWANICGDPKTEMTISWETETNGIGSVKYGFSADSLTNTQIGITGYIHHVNLTALVPGSQYYYEVFVDGKSYGTGKFKTAPGDQSTPFSWVMISDTQQLGIFHSGGHKTVAKSVPIKNHSFIPIIGDITDDGRIIEYHHDYFKNAKPYLEHLPIVPVMGNHDWRGGNNSHFYSYFPNNKGEAVNNFFCYSFNYSMVHFTIAHFTYGVDEEIIPEQMAWIDEDLKKSQDLPFRIVMFHRPIDSSSFFGFCEQMYEQLLPILYRNNVSAIIHGHEHHYERGYFEDTNKEFSDGNKIMYMILGGGGSLQDFATRRIPTAEYITSGHCYTEVFATENDLTFETRNLQGHMLDSTVIKSSTTGGP